MSAWLRRRMDDPLHQPTHPYRPAPKSRRARSSSILGETQRAALKRMGCSTADSSNLLTSRPLARHWPPLSRTPPSPSAQQAAGPSRGHARQSPAGTAHSTTSDYVWGGMTPSSSNLSSCRRALLAATGARCNASETPDGAGMEAAREQPQAMQQEKPVNCAACGSQHSRC